MTVASAMEACTYGSMSTGLLHCPPSTSSEAFRSRIGHTTCHGYQHGTPFFKLRTKPTSWGDLLQTLGQKVPHETVDVFEEASTVNMENPIDIHHLGGFRQS